MEKSEKSVYVLPDHKAERQRTKSETLASYDLFKLSDSAASIGAGKKYYIRTYGCQANVRDGESMACMLELMGFQRTFETDQADVLVFNTCAVRKAAEDHVLGEIGSLKPLKRNHPEKLFCLCGCMAQEETVVKEILRKYENIDVIFGTHNIYRLPDLIYKAMATGKRQVEVFSQEGQVIEGLPVRRTSPVKGFVNIMYGCDKFCTYCIVPYTRGRQRSRKAKDIIAEINALKESGAREVVLLGQNVNAYGKDIGMADGFASLLEECAGTGIERIRFYTSHPRDYTVSTIDVMARHENIMNSLHLPVQSGSDEILRRMARGYTADHYRELVDEMRARIPDITFTTDLIVGFPGETDEQFQDTLRLVDDCRFDMAYSFVYSPREGTPAASMQDEVDPRKKKDRLHILNERLAFHAAKKNSCYLGKTLKVLCEGKSKKNPDAYSGYSEENKLVNFSCPHDPTGEILDVTITSTHSFSLDGEAL